MTPALATTIGQSVSFCTTAHAFADKAFGSNGNPNYHGHL
jgi:hypothetical protein